MWELYLALIVMTNVMVLLFAAHLMKGDNENAIVRQIVQGLKTFFIASALIISVVAMGAGTNVIDASIQENGCDYFLTSEVDLASGGQTNKTFNYTEQCLDIITNTSTNAKQAKINNAKSNVVSMYRGMMYTYIPYVFMLLVMFIAVILTSMKGRRRE